MKQEITSQYQAAISMLISVIKKCPADIWDGPSQKHPFWQISYHALHYTNLYVANNEASFIPWIKHQPGSHQLKRPGHAADNDIFYSKDDLKNYAIEIAGKIESVIDTENFSLPSGFEWLPVNRFELHLYNLRHLQHHIGQLIERLHHSGIYGIVWAGTSG